MLEMIAVVSLFNQVILIEMEKFGQESRMEIDTTR